MRSVLRHREFWNMTSALRHPGKIMPKCNGKNVAMWDMYDGVWAFVSFSRDSCYNLSPLLYYRLLPKRFLAKKLEPFLTGKK